MRNNGRTKHSSCKSFGSLVKCEHKNDRKTTDGRYVMTEKLKSETVRQRIQVYGRVQGVGFRYRTIMAASGLNLTGWVQNLPDGSVLMEVQGREDEITELFTLVENGSWIRIDHMQKESIDLLEDEHSFGVKG